ncbi:hypothetical protein [Boseongicola sp. H5]|uniref:hypothetical protein n=1 Tax=Boseongicola sp. H5 TaxID=2763261 RepID=UPI001D0A4466|nr:hypothetical protein [Boseongicola sp. H5]
MIRGLEIEANGHLPGKEHVIQSFVDVLEDDDPRRLAASRLLEGWSAYNQMVIREIDKWKLLADEARRCLVQGNGCG